MQLVFEIRNIYCIAHEYEFISSGDLSEYAHAMAAMDESQEYPREVARQPELEAPPQKPYKMKPYTEMVKVQRPEVTRKKPAKFGLTYVGRLQSVSQSEAGVSQSEAGTARTETTQREREMIYGKSELHKKSSTLFTGLDKQNFSA